LPEDNQKREEINDTYNGEPAIRIMRSMIAEGNGPPNGIVLVGISAYPALAGSSLSPPTFPDKIDVSFEERQHFVALTHTDFLLADLVQPTPTENVHIAKLCS
jgi:hypothetical protein